VSTAGIEKLRAALYRIKLDLEGSKRTSEITSDIIEVLDATQNTKSRVAFSSSIFCVNAGHILLIKHNLLGLWLPLGGELEIWESPQEAALREAMEEAGYSDEEIAFPNLKGTAFCEPAGFIGYEEHTAGPKGTHLNFCFVAQVAHRNVKGDGTWSEHKWLLPEDVQGLHFTTSNVQYSARQIGELIKKGSVK